MKKRLAILVLLMPMMMAGTGCPFSIFDGDARDWHPPTKQAFNGQPDDSPRKDPSPPPRPKDPLPEPNSILLFGIGTIIAGTMISRRRS
jgi:hypothetical protein